MKDTSRLYVMSAAAAIFLLVRQAVSFSVFTVDDAFISFRYARNLVEGNGLVFNPGEIVEGYTNFLWTMILAGGMALNADPVAAAKFLGIMASVGTVYLVHRLSVLTRPHDSPWFLSVLAVVLLGVNGAFATAAITGLETSLFTFFIVAGAYPVVRGEFRERNTGGWLYVSPVCFALAALTRPEGVVVFAVSVAFKLLSRNLRREDLLTGARWIAVFLAIYLPYWAWRVWYYGDFLPNTFYAKTGAGLAQFYKGILDLQAFSLTYLGVIFVIALFVLARRRSPLWLIYVAGLVVTFVLLHVYEGGDWIPFYRFLVPALPFYYFVIQEGLRRLYADLRGASLKPATSHSSLLPTPLLQSLFGLACLALIVLTSSPSAAMYRELETAARGQERAHAELGKWLGEKARGPVALMDIGRIGYISRLPVVDTSGLTDRTIAHSEGGLIDKKFDLAYVLDRRPEYFVLASTTDFVRDGGEPTDFPIERRIYRDERFHRGYGHLFTLDYGSEIGGKGYYLMVYERR